MKNKPHQPTFVRETERKKNLKLEIEEEKKNEKHDSNLNKIRVIINIHVDV